MGLDMYLTARKYVSGYDFEAPEKQDDFKKVLKAGGFTSADTKYGNPSVYVSVSIGYWRKQNAIHNWFVSEVQGGVDECQKAYVSREKLQELKDVCDEVVANATKAPELLPTQSGFFFGDTGYDEWYYEGVKTTSEMLGMVLSNPKFADCDFEYQSSW